jgi:hypothetical protein
VVATELIDGTLPDDAVAHLGRRREADLPR